MITTPPQINDFHPWIGGHYYGVVDGSASSQLLGGFYLDYIGVEGSGSTEATVYNILDTEPGSNRVKFDTKIGEVKVYSEDIPIAIPSGWTDSTTGFAAGTVNLTKAQSLGGD